MAFKTFLNWSSGKDASMALYRMQQSSSHEISLLLTTLNSEYDRVSMHGSRRTLLEEQAHSIGIPLRTIELPKAPDMEVYGRIMANTIESLCKEGFTHSAFGDIFLDDLRTYRENQLKLYDIKCAFPLWKENTGVLMREFIDLGFKAIVVCVDAELLDDSFVGRQIDQAFLNDLPDNVDPCGENGEFHTFCFDGPIFKTPLKFDLGEKVLRQHPAPKKADDNKCAGSSGSWYCDLLPVETNVL